MRLAVLIVLCIWGIQRPWAMEPWFLTREIDEVYSHLTINIIYQDRNCMIWIGTSDGLMQYTGAQLDPVHFPDSSVDYIVTALFEDHLGTLWVGTQSGQIFQYHPRQGITEWKTEEGSPKVRITDFLEDTSGQIWIATYGEGIYIYSGGRLYNLNSDDGLLNDDIYMITLDPQGRIWAGTDNGISICRFDGAKHLQSITLEDGLPDQIIRAILPDASGNMWIATYEAGIAYYDLEQRRVTTVISNPGVGHINTMNYFENLELWIGTEANGLWRYHLTTGQFSKIHKVQSLQNATIRDLLKDVEGNIWVVSSDNTLHSAYRPFESLSIPIGNIQSIQTSSDGHLWLGTDDGLYHAWPDHSQGAWQYSKIENARFTSVAGLSSDAYGNIWVGSLDAGLSVFDPITQRMLAFDHLQVLRDNPVLSMFIENNTLWLATLGQGVLKVAIRGNITRGGTIDIREVKAQNGGSHNFVFQIIPRPGSEAWLATDGAGLAYSEDDRIHENFTTCPKSPDVIYSMTLDHSEHFWLNTPGNGLIEYDGDACTALTLHEGLRSLTISAIATSAKGELLIVHNKGIDVLIPEKRHFIYFDDEIGIKGAAPILNAIHKDSSGNVWIGMYNKIVKYNALHEELSIHPRTRIEQVRVNQSPIDMHVASNFASHQNFFTFDYIGLWYTSPASVKYLYTLEGHDLDWKESSDHLAIYSNLKPGKYRFLVKASENKFFYDEPLAEYAFEIQKPFWQEMWFIVLAILFGVGLVYLFMKNREARLRRIEVLNKEKIESQLRAIKAQINPHFLFNSFNTLITIIDENTDNPSVPIEYVQRLADFYRSILQYREEETISLPEEINLVRNYYYLLQHRYGNNLIMDIQEDGGSGMIPPLTLQMLMENAVKHNVISKSKPLTIRIYSNNGYLVVENNLQRKLTQVPSTRFGLQSIVNRYELITTQKVLIESTDTIFRVSIPIIKNGQYENRNH